METGKTGKYFKYAIGEIILVVIGILIALSINNWNESRKQDVTEKEFITGILNDLKQDKAYIELVIKIADKKQNTYKHISNNLSELYKTNRKYLSIILEKDRDFSRRKTVLQKAFSEAK